MNVVSNECGLKWMWSQMNVVSNEYGLKWMWPQMNVASNDCGLKWMQSQMNAVSNECGLKWLWSQMKKSQMNRSQMNRSQMNRSQINMVSNVMVSNVMVSNQRGLKWMVSNELVSIVMEPVQTLHYTSIYWWWNAFVLQCLITGLLVLCPDDPMKWIVKSLKRIDTQGLYNVSW